MAVKEKIRIRLKSYDLLLGKQKRFEPLRKMRRGHVGAKRASTNNL